MDKIRHSHCLAVTLSQEMPDLKERAKTVLGPSLALVFSSNLEQSAVLALYSSSTKDMKTYIIGCLLLSLTASVRPQFTLLADRLKTLTTLTPAMKVDEATACSLAEAGFFFQIEEDSCSSGHSTTDSAYGSSGFGSLSYTYPALVCFHCCVRVSFSQVRAHPNPLTAHRVASPNCYYARLLDLAQSHGALADTLAVSADARRYEKALRKLSVDLQTEGIGLAAQFGYEERSIIIWATRRFMRANGACPSRAGDLVALAQESEGVFADKLLEVLDVRQLLDLLDLQRRVPR